MDFAFASWASFHKYEIPNSKLIFIWEKCLQYYINISSCSLDEVIKFRGYDDVDNMFSNNRKDVLESELGGQGSMLLLNAQNSCIFIKTFDDGKRKIQFDLAVILNL